MNEEYIENFSKFLDEVNKPKEYYELTIDELIELCGDYTSAFLKSIDPEGFDDLNDYEFIDKWLTENIKENL